MIYTPFVESMFDNGADVRYMQPVTGHGLAKIMRHKKPFRYAIESVPKPQDEFRLMQEAGPVETEEAYRAWNMGVGWVVFAPHSDSRKIENACVENNLRFYELGEVQSGEREVVIAPLGVTYRPR